ncbi:MAG: hypothetical protein OHK0057_08510 [Thermoflexibacter sp.]
MKTKSIIFFTSLFLFAGIGKLFFSYPAPTYNPFDDVFNVSRERLVKEGCIEDMIECGYVNVTKDFGDGTSMYYQYFGDENTVYYKGFSINIDTVAVVDFEEVQEFTQKQIDSLYYSKDIDIESLKKRLSNINLQLISLKKTLGIGYEVELKDISQNNFHKLNIGIYLGIRTLSFDYHKPNYKKTAKEYWEDLTYYLQGVMNID